MIVVALGDVDGVPDVDCAMPFVPISEFFSPADWIIANSHGENWYAVLMAFHSPFVQTPKKCQGREWLFENEVGDKLPEL